MLERIRELCKQKGISISALEKALGFANGSIAKSDEKIQSVRIKAIADYFGVSMEYILTGDKMYYFDSEVEKETQELFDNPDLRALMNAARGCPSDIIKNTTELLKRLKGTNPDG
jgi:transcriptional regulator with XRE-family HTH domain